MPDPHIRRLLAALAMAATCLFVFVPPARGQDADAPADSAAALTGESSTEEIAARVEGMNEQMQTLLADVDRLKKFRLSGYLQVRYEVSEIDNDSVRVSGFPATVTPTNLERFYIRRARLKVTYDHSPWSQAVIYFDGGSDRQIRLLEAYAALSEPWRSEPRHSLWFGQFNVPFGYEIERSSSLRELPERSRMENVLFPGERDRGVKYVGRWLPQVETVFSVLNGGGIGSPEFPAGDPSRAKDFTGRVRTFLGPVDAAVSGYLGEAVVPVTGPDATLPRSRVGFDTQLYYPFPALGGGTLRGEIWGGHNVNTDSLNALVQRPSLANPVTLPIPGANLNHLATDFLGWYVMLVQNLGEKFQVAGRYEIFDQNVDIDHDQFERWNVAAHWFYAGALRFTAAYEIPITDRSNGAGGFVDPKDNLWTFQVQHVFP